MRVCVCVCASIFFVLPLWNNILELYDSRAPAVSIVAPPPAPPHSAPVGLLSFSIFLKPKLSFTATKNRTMRHCYPYLFFYVCLYVRLHLQIMPRPLFATADSLLHTHTHTHTQNYDSDRRVYIQVLFMIHVRNLHL